MRWSVYLGVILTLAGCDRPAAIKEEPVPPNAVRVLFTYGSEKESWIKAVTDDFHRSQPKTAGGKPIHIDAVAKGSGECIDELIAGTTKAVLTSPASAAFVKLGNAQSRAKTGRDLLGSTENLVLSPVVIAMWQPMAESLGWPEKSVGWAEILALATDPQGWASRERPQWGAFRFGHTHPQFSNSGLISVFAEVYAATGKRQGLSLEDVNRPQTAAYVRDIEKAVVHYGTSTGFFGKKMFANGPPYASAAVLYENMVIESYSQPAPTAFPLVAIYPKEGTFWSDHPAGIVDRPWVTPELREAARVYLDFLLARASQQRAMEFGFRPALAEVALAAPIDAAHGVNPREPQTTLEAPSAETMQGMLQLWQANKKRSNVTLVLDVSGSMNERGRIRNARLGAQELVTQLGDRDWFRLMAFNQSVFPAQASSELGNRRPQVLREVGSLMADGGTALYDAIAAAYDDQVARATANRDKISAIVVLTDGDDTDSRLKLPQLLEKIRPGSERPAIRIFTIGYDSGGKRDALEQIANTTQARFYEGKPENIREVFKEISTFF